jgi:hypothetical protein
VLGEGLAEIGVHHALDLARTKDILPGPTEEEVVGAVFHVEAQPAGCDQVLDVRA